MNEKLDHGNVKIWWLIVIGIKCLCKGCLQIFGTILKKNKIKKQLFWKKSGNSLLFEMRNVVCYFYVYSSVKMSHVNKLWSKNYVFTLTEEKYSHSMIQKLCDMHCTEISKRKISNIINWKGKKIVGYFSWNQRKLKTNVRKRYVLFKYF